MSNFRIVKASQVTDAPWLAFALNKRTKYNKNYPQMIV